MLLRLRLQSGRLGCCCWNGGLSVPINSAGRTRRLAASQLIAHMRDVRGQRVILSIVVLSYMRMRNERKQSTIYHSHQIETSQR